ncbi:MAG TPA: hypothetical protein VIM45_02985 [Dehalococcoidia bacterium]|jgi:hypothetical protein
MAGRVDGEVALIMGAGQTHVQVCPKVHGHAYRSDDGELVNGKRLEWNGPTRRRRAMSVLQQAGIWAASGPEVV